MTFASGGKNRPSRRRVPWPGPGRAGVLLCVLAAVALTACSAPNPSIDQLLNGTPPPGMSELGTGSLNIENPVSDLDLEAMVPPGGIWVTNGPERGHGPASFTPSLAPVRGRPGVVHAVFLCQDTGSSSIAADYSWFGKADAMLCDPGAVYTFDLDNSAKAVMPQIELPGGASWELFMWLAPPSHQPAAGASAGGAGLERFTGYGLTFTYPRSWHSLTPAQPSPYHATTLAFQSTAPLRATGRVPVAALPPDGVLVDWSMTSQGAGRTGAKLGRPQTIAGHQAWLLSRSADNPTCRKLGATWMVQATIAVGAHTSYQLLACMRGPDTSPSVKTVMATLDSLELGRPPTRV
jgi:hypothetical protein